MLTKEYLSSRLIYNPETGGLIWKRKDGFDKDTKIWNTRFANKPAGCLSIKKKDPSYWVIRIDGKLYRSHRIIWMMMTGEFCEVIDHENGDSTDNRWSNLRNIDQNFNIRKARIQSNNSSGMKGVSFNKRTGKWVARCKVGNKYKHLGYYESKESAFQAYCDKVLDLTGEIHLDLITKT